MTMFPRLNRLLAADGKCFDVAIDHGFFGEPSFLPGIEDMAAAVRTVVSADPDAVQLSQGQARLLQDVPGKAKPSLVLRTDVANIYGAQLPSLLFSELITDPVETALRLDAACVVVNLLMLPEQPELHRDCVRNVVRLRALSEKAGMPLMVEPLIMQDNSVRGGYMVDGNLEKIVTLVRQAVELGADIIKADPCDDPSQYHEVIWVAAGRPVLVRGGGRVSDRELLERTHVLMTQGASGIVYGRNVVQHPHPAAVTRALMGVVHQGLSPDEALALIPSEVAP